MVTPCEVATIEETKGGNHAARRWQIHTVQRAQVQCSYAHTMPRACDCKATGRRVGLQGAAGTGAVREGLQGFSGAAQ